MRFKLFSLLILIVSLFAVNVTRKRIAKTLDGPAEDAMDNARTSISAESPNANLPSDAKRDWHEVQEKLWKRQLNITGWLNVITAIVGFIAIGTLYFVYVQADAAKNTADTALNQLRISQRPWIGITETVILDPLIFKSDVTELRIRFTIMNSGASIANKVHKMMSVLFTRQFTDVLASETGICNVAPPQPNLAHLILPGQTKLLTAQFRSVSQKINVDEQQKTQMWLAGCVFYWDQFDKRHRTPFIYLLRAKTDSTFKPTGTIEGDLVAFPTSTAAD